MRASLARHLLFVAVLGAAGCGGDDDNGMATKSAATAPTAEPIVVELREENRSGQSGTATLTDKGLSGTAVVLKVSPPDRFPGDVQPVSYNDVSCKELRTVRGLEAQEQTVVQALTEVRDGESRTTAPRSLAELTTGGYSINVYQQNPPYVPVMCGDIPSR